jgi:hypothetical protein
MDDDVSPVNTGMKALQDAGGFTGQGISMFLSRNRSCAWQE